MTQCASSHRRERGELTFLIKLAVREGARRAYVEISTVVTPCMVSFNVYPSLTQTGNFAERPTDREVIESPKLALPAADGGRGH